MSEREFIYLCKQLIDERYLLGDSGGQWKQRDFEQLSRIIEEKSGIRISLSTLKRLWKPDYRQTPHPATLDALASLLDCKDWLDFKSSHQDRIINEVPKTRSSANWMVWTLLLITLVMVGFLVIGPEMNGSNAKQATVVTANGPVSFSTNKTVATGVPNTVIFKYDVKSITADSFYLQQSWNDLHRVPIDPKASNYSSIYYTPGFHRAKLLANDSIFKVSRIHIKTEGWLPLVKYSRDDLVPVYLRDPGIYKEGSLHVSTDQLAKAGVDIHKKFLLNYHNVQDFGLHSDNFQINTRIKCDSIGNYPCPQFSLTLVCEEHIFYFPITSKGCVANIGVKVGEVISDSKNSDLSAFGREMYHWQDLHITVENKQAQVHIGDKLVYAREFKQNFGKIMGLVLSFTGTGSVDYIALKDVQNGTVLTESL